MPRSSGRPKNRVARRWRIELAEYPFTPVTAWPFGKMNRMGKDKLMANLSVEALKR